MPLYVVSVPPFISTSKFVTPAGPVRARFKGIAPSVETVTFTTLALVRINLFVELAELAVIVKRPMVFVPVSVRAPAPSLVRPPVLPVSSTSGVVIVALLPSVFTVAPAFCTKAVPRPVIRLPVACASSTPPLKFSRASVVLRLIELTAAVPPRVKTEPTPLRVTAAALVSTPPVATVSELLVPVPMVTLPPSRFHVAFENTPTVL